MEQSIPGKVRNTQVSFFKPLVPLFEAISNSIDAIQEANETDGLIEIDIIRDNKQLFNGSEANIDRQLAEIKGFVIHDNGIGFNERTYHEFNTADTTYKSEYGGKGVGRFTWLKTFKQIEIESQFLEDDHYKLRKFKFVLKGDGIEGHECTNVPGGQRKTSVHLVDYLEKYRNNCPKTDEVIAAFIVEEFLDVFVGSSCPKILLHDTFSGNKINLNNFYDSVMVKTIPNRRSNAKRAPFLSGSRTIALYAYIRTPDIFMC